MKFISKIYVLLLYKTLLIHYADILEYTQNGCTKHCNVDVNNLNRHHKNKIIHTIFFLSVSMVSIFVILRIIITTVNIIILLQFALQRQEHYEFYSIAK